MDPLLDAYTATGRPILNPINACFVGRQGDHVTVQYPAPRYTREEALIHAAWMVFIANTLPGDATFADALASVEST